MMRCLAIAWLFSATAFGGWLGWQYFDNEIPLVYSNGRIEPDPASTGTAVSLTWDIKVNRVCPGTVHRLLYYADYPDLAPISYDRTPSALSVNQHSHYLIKTFSLPAALNPRATEREVRIRYTANVCFSCNPLQSVFTNLLCTATPELLFSIRQ